MQWLRSFDQRLRESIDYAICLNSVGSLDKDLWIHVSKPPENAYIKQIFEVITFCFHIEIAALLNFMKLQCSVFCCNRWNFV